MKRKSTITILMIILRVFKQSVFAELPSKFQKLIKQGLFTECQQSMRKELAKNLNLPALTRLELQFEIERLDRIKKDFTETRADIIPEIKKYIPEVNDILLSAWEQKRVLEFMIIDGQKRYFRLAVNNLFRIDPAAKKQNLAVLKEIHREQSSDENSFSLNRHVEQVLELAKKTHGKYIAPKRFRIKYTLTVNENVVPAGKIVRCWLPYPRERASHQTEIHFITSEPRYHIIADNHNYLQRTIYLEKIARQDGPTVFQVVFEYTGHAFYQSVTADDIQPYRMDEELSEFIAERPPHIVFTDELRELSARIVGDETNPFLIAKKIYEWVDSHIPWASAREYSTIRNISSYCYQNMHGDCGIQTLLFMTLCRLNGIPTKWQSGWTTVPGDPGIHDWGEMYFEPVGWLPVDVDHGLRESDNQNVRWFYFGNVDSYRLVVNDDYSQPLFPAKIHPRSETVDFQRGEVEWEGGNLYFDQWSYHFDVEYLD